MLCEASLCDRRNNGAGSTALVSEPCLQGHPQWNKQDRHHQMLVNESAVSYKNKTGGKMGTIQRVMEPVRRRCDVFRGSEHRPHLEKVPIAAAF